MLKYLIGKLGSLLLISTYLPLGALVVCGLSSAPTNPKNNRHVCLFDSYQAIRGPHLYALFDQLWEQTRYKTKRVAYIHAIDSDASEDIDRIQEEAAILQDELDLELCEPISLKELEFDPAKVRQAMIGENNGPQYSIVWVADHPNTFQLRHALRISCMDNIIREHCGPATGNACLFVGEGTGALCAGASMAVANLRGDDPTAAPELQFRGLEMLGPSRCIYFGAKNKQEHILLKEQLSNLPFFDEQEHSALFLTPKQVYIYSQQKGSDTTSLVMNPYQKGAIEQYESSSLEPVPPLCFDDDAVISGVGRACIGEPSEDPSRTIYTNKVEEGDYW